MNAEYTRELLVLRKKIEELEANVHSKVYLPATQAFGAPTDSVDQTVECIATGTIDRYDIVYVWHNSTDGLLPKATQYAYSTASTKIHKVGIALEQSIVGEPIRVQISGVNYARILRYVGIYGDPATNSIRTGCGLRPSMATAGRLELLRHDDVEGPTFEALGDNSANDDVVLVTIIPQNTRYRGPFKGSINSAQSQIVIGYDRAFTEAADKWGYQFSDIISWRYNSSIRTSSRTSADSVSITVDNSYVYYLVVMHPTTLVLTVTLKASATWPLDTAEGQDVNSRVVILGKARYVSTKVISWSQMHFGAIDIKTGNYQSQYGLFPVDVTYKSGSVGSASVQAAMVYDVKILGTATVLSTNVAPIWNRPALGKMVAGTSGVAYVNSSNVVILYQVDEVPDVAVC